MTTEYVQTLTAAWRNSNMRGCEIQYHNPPYTQARIVLEMETDTMGDETESRKAKS